MPNESRKTMFDEVLSKLNEASVLLLPSNVEVVIIEPKVSRGKLLDRTAEMYALKRKPGPRWWPWWPLRESDKQLRARLNWLICPPNSKP